MDPNITGLVAYPGKFRQQLMAKLYFQLVQMMSGFLPMYNIKNKEILHKLLIGSGAKPYTGKWVPKDDVSFSNRTISTEKFQRDMSIEPTKFKDTWMADQRGKGEGANNMTIPYAQFFWSKVIESLVHEIVTQLIYEGKGKAAFAAYAGGTAYSVGNLIVFTQANEARYFECIAATSAGQSPDTHPAKWKWAGAKAIIKGLKAIFQDDVTANLLTPVSTGALTNTTAYAQFTQLWRSLPVQIRDQGGLIHCSYDGLDLLTDDFENRVTKNFETIDGITYLAKTNRKCIIKPQVWLTGSALIGTKDQNLVLATDELSDMNDIKTVPAMYTVDAGITAMIGVNYQDEEVIRINDQAIV